MGLTENYTFHVEGLPEGVYMKDIKCIYNPYKNVEHVSLIEYLAYQHADFTFDKKGLQLRNWFQKALYGTYGYVAILTNGEQTSPVFVRLNK